MNAATRQQHSLTDAIGRLFEAASMAVKRRAIAKLERRLQRAFRRYFKAQGRLVLAGIGKLRRRPQRAPIRAAWRGGVAATGFRRLSETEPPDLPDFEEILEELIKAGTATQAIIDQLISKILEQALDAGAEAALKGADVAIQFDLTSKAAVEFVQARAADLVAGINETSRAQLRTLITNAVKDGESYNQLAGSIREMFDGFSDYRSRTIAVTEIGNAYEEGALLASQALVTAGLQMEKAWLTAGDDRVEEECQGNAEAGWIALGEDFPSGDARPLAHPNCRCTMLSRRKPNEQERLAS